MNSAQQTGMLERLHGFREHHARKDCDLRSLRQVGYHLRRGILDAHSGRLQGAFLQEQGIRYDEILFGMPMGERIVVNDRKPSGLEMAVALNMDRDPFVMMPKVIRKR